MAEKRGVFSGNRARLGYPPGLKHGVEIALLAALLAIFMLPGGAEASTTLSVNQYGDYIAVSNAFYNLTFYTPGCAVMSINGSGGPEWVKEGSSHLRIVGNSSVIFSHQTGLGHSATITEQDKIHVNVKCGSGANWMYMTCYEDFPYCFFNYSVASASYVENNLAPNLADVYFLGTNKTNKAAGGDVFNDADRGFAAINTTTAKTRLLTFLFDKSEKLAFTNAFDGAQDYFLLGVGASSVVASLNMYWNFWYGLSAPHWMFSEALNESIKYIESRMEVQSSNGYCIEQSNATNIFDCATDNSNILSTYIVQNNTNVTGAYFKVKFGKPLSSTKTFYIYNSSGGTPTSPDLYVMVNASGTFMLNGSSLNSTNAGNYTAVYNSSSGNDSGIMYMSFSSDIYLTVTDYYPLAAQDTFTLNVFNATDNGNITQWSVIISNGTMNYTHFSNNNPHTTNLTLIPTGGSVQATVWHPTNGNITFNFTSNRTENLSLVVHLVEKNFLVLILPANNSVYSSGLVSMNITTPQYMDGNASIWYRLNMTGPFILGCTECRYYEKSMQFGFGPSNITALINATSYYPTRDNENKTINFEVFNSKYNISFYDEMTNRTMDFSPSRNASMRIKCSDREDIIANVSGALNDYIINCTGALEEIKVSYYDPNNDHYRTLIPKVSSGNLTFYLINTSPSNVVINKLTYVVTDASGNYLNGIIHIRKVVLGQGLKDIIDVRMGADGNAIVHLISGEKYRLYVESENGLYSKTLGDYMTPISTATSQPLTIIDLSFIPAQSYYGTDISWEMQFNITEHKIFFYWNDKTNKTTNLKFWIYNGSNIRDPQNVYFDSVSMTSVHFFQWAISQENDSYVGYFEAQHVIYGNVSESRVLVKGGVMIPLLGPIGVGWYNLLALAVLVFTGSLFGARSASIGGVLIALLGGVFLLLHWIPLFPNMTEAMFHTSDLIGILLIALGVLALIAARRRV